MNLFGYKIYFLDNWSFNFSCVIHESVTFILWTSFGNHNCRKPSYGPMHHPLEISARMPLNLWPSKPHPISTESHKLHHHYLTPAINTTNSPLHVPPQPSFCLVCDAHQPLHGTRNTSLVTIFTINHHLISPLPLVKHPTMKQHCQPRTTSGHSTTIPKPFQNTPAEPRMASKQCWERKGEESPEQPFMVVLILFCFWMLNHWGTYIEGNI